MKELIFALMMSFSVSGMTQTPATKPVMCFPFERLMTTLVVEFGETDIVFDQINEKMGDDSIVLTRNPSTGSWTIVEYDNKHISGCILGAGTQKNS